MLRDIVWWSFMRYREHINEQTKIPFLLLVNVTKTNTSIIFICIDVYIKTSTLRPTPRNHISRPLIQQSHLSREYTRNDNRMVPLCLLNPVNPTRAEHIPNFCSHLWHGIGTRVWCKRSDKRISKINCISSDICVMHMLFIFVICLLFCLYTQFYSNKYNYRNVCLWGQNNSYIIM